MTKILQRATACIAALLAFAAHAQQYSVTDLGTLGGGSSSRVALNNSGQVAGTSATASGATDAFLHSNGAMTDLGTWTPLGMNDVGQIVGQNSQSQAVIYSAGNLNQIPLTGYSFSTATGINNSGQVVGVAGTGIYGADSGDTYIYNSQTGSIQIITAAIAAQQPPNEGFGTVFTQGKVVINASGEIAGTAEITNSSNAYSYSNGTVKILGGGNPPKTTVAGINANGAIAFNLGPEPWLLASNGASTFIGGNIYPAAANGLNDLDQVVGEGVLPDNGPTHAFIFDTGGQPIDLNSEIGSAAALFTLVSGQAINDSGQILVDGYVNATGQEVAFLLTPTAVPLPAAAWLMLGGLGALGFSARTRRVA